MSGLRAPRARSALRASALYLYGVGALLVALTLAFDPTNVTDIPHGVLLGLLISRLALVLLPLASPVPRPRLATVELVVAVLAVVAALPGLHPSIFLLPALAVLPPAALTWFAVAYGVATLESLGTALRATVGALGVPAREWRERGRGTAALTVGIGSAGIAFIAALLDVGPRLEWLDPPFTLDARTVLSIALLAPLTLVARALAESSESGVVIGPYREVDEPDAAPLPLGPGAVGVLVMLETLFLAVGTTLAPYGAFPSSLSVEASTARPELAHDGVDADLFRRAQRRSGLFAAGERFIVRYGDGIVGGGFDSLMLTAPDGAVVILVNEGIPASRRRNLLLDQFTRGLLALKAPAVGGPVARGYTYWAAENSRNPFVVGLSSGVSPQGVCATSATTPVEGSDLPSRSLQSLPFIQAEARGGPREAQELLLRAARWDPPTYRGLIEAECVTYVATHPAPPELVVDPSAPGGAPAIDPAVARAAFDEAKSRSGMDALGRPITVRVGALPSGSSSHSDFTDGTHVVITLSSSLPTARRPQQLVFQLTGIFVTTRYGNAVEPVRSAFAAWASRDPADPFVTDASTGRSLCQAVATADLSRTTAAAVYLSSLPFFDAEREGGRDAVQELLRRSLARPIDLAEWRTVLAGACARRYPAAT